MIPLILRLRKETHKKIALAQDIIVRELYNVFDNAVFHGGTAIWRCYGGNRFSEDIDVYIPRDIARIELLFASLEKNGFIIEKKKIGVNSLYSSMKLDRINVRLEAVFKKVNGTLKDYETADGNMMTVYTLTPEEFVQEKADAYMKRLKVRDLYDIFFLMKYIKDKSAVRKKLMVLIENFRKPVDEKDLKVLLLGGIVPGSQNMLEYIRNGI